MARNVSCFNLEQSRNRKKRDLKIITQLLLNIVRTKEKQKLCVNLNHKKNNALSFVEIDAVKNLRTKARCENVKK